MKKGEAIVSPDYKDAAQADVLSVLGLSYAAKVNFFHVRNDNISSKKVLTLALKYGIIEGWVSAAGTLAQPADFHKSQYLSPNFHRIFTFAYYRTISRKLVYAN